MTFLGVNRDLHLGDERVTWKKLDFWILKGDSEVLLKMPPKRWFQNDGFKHMYPQKISSLVLVSFLLKILKVALKWKVIVSYRSFASWVSYDLT